MMRKNMDGPDTLENSLVGGLLKKLARDEATSEIEDAVRVLIVDSIKMLDTNKKSTNKSIKEWEAIVLTEEKSSTTWDDDRWDKLRELIKTLSNTTDRKYGSVIDNIEEIATTVRRGGFPKIANEILDLRRKWVDYTNSSLQNIENLRIRLELARSNRTPNKNLIDISELNVECES